MNPEDGNVVPKSDFLANGFLVAVIEAAAIILWQFADSLGGYLGIFVHWLSLICFTAGPIPFLRPLFGGKRRMVISAYGCLWFILATAAYAVWRPTAPTPVTIIPSESKPPEHQPMPIVDQVAYYSKIAQARQWQPPIFGDMPPSGEEPRAIINFGDVPINMPIPPVEEADTAPPAIIFGGGSPFTPYTKDNRIYIKARTMFADGEKTVQMNDDWTSEVPEGGDKNFNENSFEIVDADLLPVFQIRYETPTEIDVNGIFVAPTGEFEVAFGRIISFYGPGTRIPKIEGRKAWFKYPSKDHLGELAQ